jgi:hypothetical protein
MKAGPSNPDVPKILFVTLVLLAGIAAACHPMILSGLQLVQTDPGDTRLNNYILEHSYQWLAGNALHRHFWNLPIFFPTTHTGAYGDILLGAAPLYWYFRMGGLAPDTSLQMRIIRAFALNFLAAFLVFRSGLRLNTLAAAAGAYLFAFAGIRISQLGHQQLIPQFFSMLAVYALCRLYRDGAAGGVSFRGVAGWTIILAAMVVLQLYTAIYLGWFLCFGLSLFLGVAACFRETRPPLLRFLREYRWLLLSVALVALASLSWLGYHYFLTYREFGGRPWWEVHNQVPRLLSWFDLGKQNWLYGWTWDLIPFSRIPTEHEHRIGLGLVTMVLAIVGLVRLARTPWGRVLAVTTLLIFSLASIYPGGWTPWRVVYVLVPGASAIRGVARISLLLLIGFSFGLAYFFAGLKSKGLALALLCLVLLEQGQTTPAYDKYAVRTRVATIVRLIPRDCQAFYYVNLDFDQRGLVDIHQIDAMWAGLASGVPTMNGYHGWFPRDWEFCNFIRSEITHPAGLAKVQDKLQAWLKRQHLPGRLSLVTKDRDGVYLLSRDHRPPPAP